MKITLEIKWTEEVAADDVAEAIEGALHPENQEFWSEALAGTDIDGDPASVEVSSVS